MSCSDVHVIYSSSEIINRAHPPWAFGWAPSQKKRRQHNFSYESVEVAEILMPDHAVDCNVLITVCCLDKILRTVKLIRILINFEFSKTNILLTIRVTGFCELLSMVA